jgi:hypothetical protein
MLQYPEIVNHGAPMVAFYGPMCSGKTTAAEKLFRPYSKLSLAAEIKQIAANLYGVTGKTNDERKILQELADDLKKWDGNVFTKKLLNLIQFVDHSLPIVVDDVRYNHEAQDLRRYGFKIVRVYVPEDIRQARIAAKYPDTDPARFEHPTEKDWKNIEPDFTISGEGEEGLANLREILKRYKP